MIFGNKENFAIEAMIEPRLNPPSYVWGRLRIWILNIPIGNYDDPYCALYPSYSGFKEVSIELDSLWLDDFYTLSDSEIWNLLDGSIYGYHGKEEIDYDKLYGDKVDYSAMYGKFNFLTNWGEMFDQDPRGKAFLFKEPGEKIKVLTHAGLNDTVESFYCNEFSFRSAVNEFCAWYDDQERILDSKNA